MPDIAIRADADRRLGWGHVKRCLALAAALKRQGATLTLLARESDIALEPLCAEVDVRVRRLPGSPAGAAAPDAAEDAAATLAELARAPAQAPALVVVDHYELDARWHQALRRRVGLVVVIDDLADRALDPDILIDPNPHPDHALKYRKVLRRQPRLLGGPAYALLDAAYAEQARRPRPWHDEVRSIGIFLGGTDPTGVSALALQACRAAGFGGPIEIASTGGNPRLAPLRAAVAADPAAKLLLDQPHLASFNARHDLIVGAGGGASWERCCLGVPSIALICADNQTQAVRPLAEAGVALCVDMRTDPATCAAALRAAIARSLAAPALRRHQAETGRRWVDGRGAERAADALLQLHRSTLPA